MRTATLLALALVLPFAPAARGDDDKPPAGDPKAQALKLNQEANTEDGANAKLKELLKNKESKAKAAALVKAAHEVQTKAQDGEKPFKFYPALVLARVAHAVKEYDAAETFYKYCTATALNELKSGKLLRVALGNHIDYLWDRRRYDKVVELCKETLEKDVANDEDKGKALKQAELLLLEQMIRAQARNKEYDEALRMAETLVVASKSDWPFLQLKGFVQREAGKLEEAIGTYREVLEKVEKDDRLSDEEKKGEVRQTKYFLSGLYLDNSQIDKSSDMLEALLKDDPDNPGFNNDLGFLWADQNRKLDEAEKLIRKAIEFDLKRRKEAADKGNLDPDEAKTPNAAYADSLGWVLYRKGKYEDALKHLLEASRDEGEGQHVEIWDHLGDCYLALGKKKEALETYQKALSKPDVSKKDVERRKKVTDKARKLKAELEKKDAK